jgi:hypothetical protein
MVAALSARSLLLLAIIGAFALSFYVLANQSVLAIIVVAIYCVFAILPVAYLEIRRSSD